MSTENLWARLVLAQWPFQGVPVDRVPTLMTRGRHDYLARRELGGHPEATVREASALTALMKTFLNSLGEQRSPVATAKDPAASFPPGV